MVKMPARHMLQMDAATSQGMEELQTSPEFEIESAELERELDNAEQHLDKGVAMATEESDADTVSTVTFQPSHIGVDEAIRHRRYTKKGIMVSPVVASQLLMVAV